MGVEHQTIGVRQHTAGVRSEDYWLFQPGQRVKTTDGPTGRVEAVFDGPYPGSEEYEVTLDGGLGGGQYTASQLRPAPTATAAVDGTAAADYPELTQILQERPDPAHLQLTASRHDDEDELEAREAKRGYVPSRENVYWHGTPSGDLRGGAYGLHLGTQEAARQALTARIGHPVDGSWDGTRTYGETLLAGKKTLRERGTPVTGYSHTHAPDHDHYATGGATYSDRTPVPMDAKPNVLPVRIRGEMANDESTPHDDAKANGLMARQIRRGKAQRGFFYTNDGEDAGSVSAVVPSQEHIDLLPQNKTARHFSDMVVTAATDPDFRFQVTAAWRDVVAKAKRIRSEGGVRVTMASDGIFFGEVQGDHHVYETGLQRLPGRMAAHSWNCGCKWGAYHWGADDDFSRFAGRMCSHALALQYEVQSKGMFGRDINADEHKPAWVPRHVVVRHDIDSGTNKLQLSSALHETDELPAEGVLQTIARAAVAAGEDGGEVALALRTAGVEASVYSPFGEPAGTAYQLPKAPGATSPKQPWENPASAGPLAAADPVGWNRKLPLESYAALDSALFEPSAEAQDGAEAMLHEEPEAALPGTDGVQIPSNDEALTPSMTAGLRRQALKDFSFAEQQELINEGEGVKAANLDRLDIEGTHYAELESVLAGHDDDATWLA